MTAPQRDDAVRRTIVDHLRSINPTALDRVDAPGSLKLRRVLDSLDMVEFLAFLEKAFSIRISDQDVLSRNFESVGSVIEFVAGRKAPDPAQD
ncbi:MAG: acyl carrier protein [Acidobacteriota bacterium]